MEQRRFRFDAGTALVVVASCGSGQAIAFAFGRSAPSA